MGGGLEADLSQGAVPALWSVPQAAMDGPRLRPVLQVADVCRHALDDDGPGPGLRPSPAAAAARITPLHRRCRLLLSDGVHTQHALLAPDLHHLVATGGGGGGGGGALRRGSVVRVVNFVHLRDQDYVRTMVIIRLEILQTECALIGSLKLYKPRRNSGVFSTSRSTSYGPWSDCAPCFGVQHIQYGPSCSSYPSGGDELSSVAQSGKSPVWKLVGQIKDENLGYSDKPDLITVKATIASVNPRLLHYVACPLVVNGKRCNAKATRVDGMWRCKSCEYSFRQSSEYGCSVRIQIQDHTGTTSATVCEEAVEDIFGCRGRDLNSLKYTEQGFAQLHDILLGAVCKQYAFRLKVEGQSPQPSGIVECIVLKAEKVNPSADPHRLRGQIDRLLEEGSGSGLELHNPTMPTYTGSLESRVCSSVRRSSNSIDSGHAATPGRARPLGSQTFSSNSQVRCFRAATRRCTVSEQQLDGSMCYFSRRAVRACGSR